jgi:TPR repeat protein
VGVVRLYSRSILPLEPCSNNAKKFFNCYFDGEIDLNEIVRNSTMGNYKVYTKFKMARYGNACKIWQGLAQRDNAEANFNLGILYDDGLGVSQDMAKALLYYETAAIGGSFKAQ